MSVMISTSAGELVIDLFCEDCPITTKNFLKLCKIKYEAVLRLAYTHIHTNNRNTAHTYICICTYTREFSVYAARC
jgi:cyclophilin family peptidyl-prolyl cis-trans isomerase